MGTRLRGMRTGCGTGQTPGDRASTSRSTRHRRLQGPGAAAAVANDAQDPPPTPFLRRDSATSTRQPWLTGTGLDPRTPRCRPTRLNPRPAKIKKRDRVYLQSSATPRGGHGSDCATGSLSQAHARSTSLAFESRASRASAPTGPLRIPHGGESEFMGPSSLPGRSASDHV